MAITLGDLRTFCREIASPDSSGETAEREFMVWINSAIQRIYSEMRWDEVIHERKLTIVPQEEIDTFVVTQGSLALACVAPDEFDAKYVSEEWELHLDGESFQTFRLASITDDQNAVLRAGDEWIQDSDTGVTGYFVRRRYTLPDQGVQVHRVQLLETSFELDGLQPHEFDREISRNPNQRGAYPRIYTLREGLLEIWPHPGDNYLKLGISYRKGPTTYEDDALDAEEIGWPEHWRDLLFKALQLEAVITLGSDAPISYQIAKIEFTDRLNRYKGLDSNRDELAGPLCIRAPLPAMIRHPRSFSHPGPLVDD